MHFLKLSAIKLAKDERYETYFQRILAHLYDNLLSAGSTLKFDGESVTENEEMSHTVERLAVFLWLHFIDERLRNTSQEFMLKICKVIQLKTSSPRSQ